MDVRKFWKRVCDEIKIRKMSRKKFAENINVPYNTFKSWLYYERSVEVGTAHDIATALGVSLDYLITGTDVKGKKPRIERIEDRKTAKAEMKELLGRLQEEMAKL